VLASAARGGEALSQAPHPIASLGEAQQPRRALPGEIRLVHHHLGQVLEEEVEAVVAVIREQQIRLEWQDHVVEPSELVRERPAWDPCIDHFYRTRACEPLVDPVFE
jgi:hypothetical protein